MEQRHRDEWLKSCVSEEIITQNVWSVEDPRDVDQLLNRNTDRRWKHSTDLAPGWAVAGVDPLTGERTFKGVQYKPDVAPRDPETGKPRKYFSPSKQTLSPLFLGVSDAEYWRKLLTDFTSPLVLTEGAKKAGAVLSLGVPCISIPGVSTGGKLGRIRPELEMYCRFGRRIYLAFDRDVISKPQVRRALHNLGRMVTAKGAMVYVVEWDNRHKGIDDFIASGGDARQRVDQALTLEEWKEQCEQEDETEPVAGEKCPLAVRYEMAKSILDGRLQWNSLKGKIEMDGEPIELEHLRLYLAVKHNIGIPSEDCFQICSYLAKKRTFSPVAEYLKQCGKICGSDSELLDSLAETYLGAKEELHKVYIRKTLISAVARAMQPGCKVDTVAILSGGQGVGKSSFWKILAGEEWFDDSVGSVSDKDERLKLHQAWFIEWAELEAVFKRKDISAVKAFITTQADQVRPPYGRSVQEFQRPSIIVGSTNESEFLADPTGNRRYWVVPVNIPAIPLDQLAAERDRIWAAAFHAWKSGELWTLPADLRKVAEADAANYTMSDPWEEPVLEYCGDRQRVTINEILINALNLDFDKMEKRSQMRVTSILKMNGWRNDGKRQLIAGQRLRVWLPPIDPPTEAEAQGVGSQVDQSSFEKNAENSKFCQIGGSGGSQEAQNQMALSDPPLIQPPDQPPDQPPEKMEESPPETGELNEVIHLIHLIHPFPKSSRTQECNLSPIENDVVIINGSARWIKQGSSPLPWQELPKKYRQEPEIPLEVMGDRLFQEFMAQHRVISVSHDGQRVKVRNQDTGRNSVFSINDVQVLQRGEAYANG